MKTLTINIPETKEVKQTIAKTKLIATSMLNKLGTKIEQLGRTIKEVAKETEVDKETK